MEFKPTLNKSHDYVVHSLCQLINILTSTTTTTTSTMFKTTDGKPPGFFFFFSLFTVLNFNFNFSYGIEQSHQPPQ
jgi:hypothetical protein